MKYLIILLLFITSCTDKKQITADPIVVEPITPKAPSSPKITKLSYENDLDLMLVDTTFQQWYTGLLNENHQSDDRLAGYYAMYWDTNTQTYYGVFNNNSWYGEGYITNQQFEYTIDKTKQYEAVFHPSMKEVFTNTRASLLYIGSISPLERVYLDPTNQEYYIKSLAPWDTSIYTVYVTEDTYNTNTLPIFPYYDLNFSNIETNYNQETDTDIISTNNDTPDIFYTNSDGDKFSGIAPRTPMSLENF